MVFDQKITSSNVEEYSSILLTIELLGLVCSITFELVVVFLVLKAENVDAEEVVSSTDATISIYSQVSGKNTSMTYSENNQTGTDHQRTKSKGTIVSLQRSSLNSD